MSNFKDDSGHLAWDCSAWVRTYALFLEERLECFAVLLYDVEAECLRAPAPAAEGQTPHTKAQSRTRGLGKDDLLEQLPALQQLLFRLVSCQPEGAAFGNYLIQYALALVLKESFKIYCAVNDGIINLVDVFFDMSKLDAIKAQGIYRRTGTLLLSNGAWNARRRACLNSTSSAGVWSSPGTSSFQFSERQTPILTYFRISFVSLSLQFKEVLLQ